MITRSPNVPVSSGVPQGTVLGPLLFLLYINDLPNEVISNIRLFADDAILYREIKGSDDNLILQEDLNNLCRWEKKWQMSFNSTKCHSMHITHKIKSVKYEYSMNGIPLKSVDHHPYLGIELTKDLNWSTHINQVTNKANKVLGLLRRNLHSCSKSVKDTAYQTLVRPRLEYAGAIWDPYKTNSKTTLEKVQRRAARFVCNNYKQNASVSEMLESLHWDPLELRRTRLRLIAIYKEVHNITPSNLSQSLKSCHDTRQSTGSHIITMPKFNKLCYQYSLYPRTIREWNLLPHTIRSATDIDQFKRDIGTLDLNGIVHKAHFKI